MEEKKEDLIELIAKIAECQHTLSQIVEELYELTGLHITLPTVAMYLKLAWGDEYSSKKEAMTIRRARKRHLAQALMTEAKREE